MQNVGLVNKYDSVEGSLANGTNADAVTFTNVTNAFYTMITNDSSSDDFTVQVNDSDLTISPFITVKAGETLKLNEMQVSSIFLTNNSGGAINYRILIVGS